MSARESFLKRISGMFRRHIVVLRDGLRLPEIKFCKASEMSAHGGADVGCTTSPPSAVAAPPSHPALSCVSKVDGLPMNNNHFQSRTQNGHPYPARQRAMLQPMQGGGRGES